MSKSKNETPTSLAELVRLVRKTLLTKKYEDQFFKLD
jgi:hypothetical protein